MGKSLQSPWNIVLSLRVISQSVRWMMLLCRKFEPAPRTLTRMPTPSFSPIGQRRTISKMKLVTWTCWRERYFPFNHKLFCALLNVVLQTLSVKERCNAAFKNPRIWIHANRCNKRSNHWAKISEVNCLQRKMCKHPFRTTF